MHLYNNKNWKSSKKRELIEVFIVIFGFSAQKSTRNDYFHKRKKNFLKFCWPVAPGELCSLASNLNSNAWHFEKAEVNLCRPISGVFYTRAYFPRPSEKFSVTFFWSQNWKYKVKIKYTLFIHEGHLDSGEKTPEYQ